MPIMEQRSMVAVPPREPDGDQAKYNLQCSMCGWNHAPDFVLVCPECGGALEANLRLAGAKVREHPDPARAYMDFLPLDSDRWLDDNAMMHTPCRVAPTLGTAIGVPRLWVKDESVHPTGTTKDRMAAVVVAVFRQYGIREFVASSTGNSSTALARVVQQDGSMRAHFFCGADFVPYHNFDVTDRVSLTVVEGSYAAASQAAQAYAREQGLRWEGGYFNWARREGLKIAYLEAIDEMGTTPDVVVQAVSSGQGIAAADKAIREFLLVGRVDRTPRFLMVQQDTCAPMARAWAEGRAELTDADSLEHPAGLATAILLGDGRASYPYMAAIASRSAGSIIAVSQNELITAKQLLADTEGLDVCYSSAATIAGVRIEAAAGRIDPEETVLVNLTGRHR
jgi:threonine synthase